MTVTATPAANYELESITTNGTAITGTTFVMPAEAVTVAATFKQVQSGPEYPKTWPLEETYTAKFVAWAAKQTGVTDFSDYAAQFLMNIASDATPTLTISSIEIVDGDAKIVIDGGDANLAGINGVLYVAGAAEIGGEWVTTTIDATADSFTEGKATFTVPNAKFMKAKIGFKAETPAKNNGE